MTEHSDEIEPLCGGCNPPPPGTEITQTVWLCPDHQAQQDALMEKIGDALMFRVTVEPEQDGFTLHLRGTESAPDESGRSNP